MMRKQYSRKANALKVNMLWEIELGRSTKGF
jgi:hypothetical protein